MQTNSTPKDVLSYVGNGMNKKMWWAFVLFFYTAPLIGAIILDVDVSVVTLIICAAIDLFMWKLIMSFSTCIPTLRESTVKHHISLLVLILSRS